VKKLQQQNCGAHAELQQSETCVGRELNEETNTIGIGVRAQFIKKNRASQPCSLKDAVFDYLEMMSRKL
jgi:hypothetical protein